MGYGVPVIKTFLMTGWFSSHSCCKIASVCKAEVRIVHKWKIITSNFGRFICLSVCVCVGCCRGGGQRPCSLFRWVGPYFSGVFSGLCAAGPLLQDPQRIHGTYWSFFNLRYRAGLQLSGIMLIYPNAFWLYIKGGHTRLTLLVCLIQSYLYWLTWNTPEK